MGKLNFHELYQAAKEARGSDFALKLSFYCDLYRPDGCFAGLIVYHKDDSHEWQQLGHKGGFKGKSMYVIIQDTTNWHQDEFKNAGQGKVHDALYRHLLNEDFRGQTACCGGFAVVQGTVKFSSVWLNMSAQRRPGLAHPWDTDGDKMLSDGERALVCAAITHWVTEWHELRLLKRQQYAKPVPLGRAGADCLIEQAVMHGAPCAAALPTRGTNANGDDSQSLDSLSGQPYDSAFRSYAKTPASAAEVQLQFASKNASSEGGGWDAAFGTPYVNVALVKLERDMNAALAKHKFMAAEKPGAAAGGYGGYEEPGWGGDARAPQQGQRRPHVSGASSAATADSGACCAVS
eukprot:TRINITY_DN14120_c0_g1_i1.p1 TRINITY_DN14120_c0_g1~~TRINITY_DN14120_c0_g1_i1.p1  ORF type:complete len:348 (+),score=114.80 TRINITY_DN14120_c0_g1_i1:150-1193(+)